jgi:small-conductance mechanosensitive channel
VLPPFFTRHRIFGHSLAQMVGLASSLLIPLVVLYLLTEVLIRVLRRTEDLQRHQLFETWFASLRWPAILFLSLMIHLGGARVMGLALTFRLRYGRVLVAVIVFTAAWLLRRLLALGFERARTLMPGAMHGGTRSLLLLAERLAKAFVVVVAIVVILGIAGVDTLTSLAGLGIGGIALALGAQKTVENFLGGVFLLSDRALAVGDKCTIGNRLGFVEDITLRSVRLRTMEQTLLSIPAGTLSQSNVENWATRTKSLIQQRVPLRYGTSADQLRAILGSIAGFLAEHPRIERGSARIRLVDFGERAIELEIFCYVLTGEVPQYLIVKEEVLLRIATIVEAEGSGIRASHAVRLHGLRIRSGARAAMSCMTSHGRARLRGAAISLRRRTRPDDLPRWERTTAPTSSGRSGRKVQWLPVCVGNERPRRDKRRIARSGHGQVPRIPISVRRQRRQQEGTMDPKQMLMLALMVSIMLTVFGFGLRASFGDLLYLVRHPGLLSRTLVSMFVIMPIAAMVLVSVFDLDPRVKIALVALAISPVPPMLPNKASKVEEEDGYPIALVATMALLSIIVAPIAINIVGRFAGQDLAIQSSLVAKTVLKSALVPLLAGVLVRQFLPGVAARIAKPVSTIGGILLAIAALILLVVTASTLMALATPKTLLAIAAFVIIGFVTGHLMGGQDHGHGAVLGPGDCDPTSRTGHGDRNDELPHRAHWRSTASLPARGCHRRHPVREVGEVTAGGDKSARWPPRRTTSRRIGEVVMATSTGAFGHGRATVRRAIYCNQEPWEIESWQ